MKLRATPVVITAEASAPRLRASLSVISPVVSARVAYARATTSAVIPSADVAYVLPVSAVSYIELAVGMEVDETGRYRYVADTAITLEQVFIDTVKSFADAVQMVHNEPVFDVAKALTDSTTITDAVTVVLVFIRNFADSAGVSDVSAYAFIKALVDSVSTTEQLYFAISKLLTDGVGMIDSFDLYDGATYTFTKALSNVSFATDAVVLTPQKGVLDTITMDSAGYLRSQGYCDFTYFAEDYVGDSRTFT